MEANPKKTIKQSATAGNAGRTFSIADGLSAAGNDELLRVILFIMR
jgi:hypothetical protein